jgi:hypothetical protein
MEFEGTSMPYVHTYRFIQQLPNWTTQSPVSSSWYLPLSEGTPLLVLMALQLFGCPVQVTQYIRSSYHIWNVSSTKITSQNICTLYFRRLLNFDFEHNSSTEFHENPTNGLDAHTRSWPRIKQRHQHCYLFTWVRFEYSGILRRVDWHIVTDLPNDRCVFEKTVTTYQSTQTTSDFSHNKFTFWFHYKENSKT